MSEKTSHLRWTRPDWLLQAHAWISNSLEETGRKVVGPIQQTHVRPWSTILRVPVAEGFAFFKASIPLLAGEPALTRLLYRWHPECTFRLLAADLERGWMLVPDGGTLLRLYLKTPADLWRVERLMPAFARLQIGLLDHLEELLPVVPFDRRLDRIPELFQRLLEDRLAMRIGQKDGLSEAQYLRLRRLLPRFGEMCAQLAAAPIPQTLHHDDFHDGNIFGGGDDDRYIVSDWGESCLSHPFFSLLVCLRALAFRVGMPEHFTDVPEELPPELTRLRDLYLASWERFASHADLVTIFNLAWRVGMVNRALTWYQVVSSIDPNDQPDYAYAVPAWLGEFLTLMERTVRKP